MSYSLCSLEPAIHRNCHHLLVRLFSVCAVVPIFITLFGVRPNFKTRTTAFYTFYFFYFSQWILYIAGARETQEDTL